MELEVLKCIEETDEWKALNMKYEEQRLKAIAYLGSNWVLHPNNHTQRKGDKNGS